MDIRIGITCDHKCMFNWSAFEAQLNKANKFPGIINIIVLSFGFWFLKSYLRKKIAKKKIAKKQNQGKEI